VDHAANKVVPSFLSTYLYPPEESRGTFLMCPGDKEMRLCTPRRS